MIHIANLPVPRCTDTDSEGIKVYSKVLGLLRLSWAPVHWFLLVNYQKANQSDCSAILYGRLLLGFWP